MTHDDLKYSPRILRVLIRQLNTRQLDVLLPPVQDRALLVGRPHRECPDPDLCAKCRDWITQLDKELWPMLREAAQLLHDYLALRLIGFARPTPKQMDDFVNALLNRAWEDDWLKNLPPDDDPMRRRVAVLRLEQPNQGDADHDTSNKHT